MIYLLFTLLIVLASLDSWLTRKALKCGCPRETNWIMDKLGKWKYIFKGLVVVTIGAFSLILDQWAALAAIDLWMAYVCYGNWKLIKKYT